MKNFYKLAILLFTVFVVAELTCRIYQLACPSFIFASDSYNRFRGKPFSRCLGFQLNSKGFNDKEYPREKEPGTWRIVAIGDSFVFGGVPYQHNFLTLLEERLNESGRRCEVINMGIPCTGPDSYFSLLIREALDLSPDLVLCCFFIGNDFTDDASDRGGERSYLASLFRFLFKLPSRPVSARQALYAANYADYRDSEPDFSEEEFMRLESERSAIFLKDAPVLKERLPYVISSLGRIRDYCRKNSARLLVVLIPDELQIEPLLQDRVARRIGKNRSGDFDFSMPNRLLCAELSRMGIDHLDLLADFSANAVQARLYKPRNTHWNIMGNALAAACLYKSLGAAPERE